MKKILSLIMIVTILFSSASFANESTKSISDKQLTPPVYSTRSYTTTAEEFFGPGWRMTRAPIVRNSYFRESTRTERIVSNFVVTALGLIPGVAPNIFVEYVKYELKMAIFDGQNGVFSKTYYLAKPVRDELQNVNIPVACNVQMVTIFYTDTSCRITKYLTSQTMSEVPNVQNIGWHQLASPSTSWNF